MQISLTVLPPLSSHTQLTFTSSSPYQWRPNPQYLLSFTSVLSLLLLKNNKKVVGGIISIVFLGSSHTNSNCSQTHRSTGCFTIVAISEPCAEAQGQQKPRIRLKNDKVWKQYYLLAAVTVHVIALLKLLPIHWSEHITSLTTQKLFRRTDNSRSFVCRHEKNSLYASCTNMWHRGFIQYDISYEISRQFSYLFGHLSVYY